VRRTTKALSFALVLALASCSGAEPKQLIDSGYAALGSGNREGAIARFDEALATIGSNTNDPNFLPAHFGRCQALAKVDPARANAAFLALAKSKPDQIRDKDFNTIGEYLLTANTPEARLEAVRLLEAGHKMFPASKDIETFQKRAAAESKRTGDIAMRRALDSIPYLGSGD
jgi:hypothetical protein